MVVDQCAPYSIEFYLFFSEFVQCTIDIQDIQVYMHLCKFLSRFVTQRQRSFGWWMLRPYASQEHRPHELQQGTEWAFNIRTTLQWELGRYESLWDLLVKTHTGGPALTPEPGKAGT